MDTEEYMRDRVEDQLGYYRHAATSAKRRYMWTQSAIIVLAVLLPVMVNMETNWDDTLDLSEEFRIITTVLSLSLAILTGLLSFRKYGELWLSHRMTEELIKQEKFLFLTRSGKYEENQSAFSDFVGNIEAILSSEHNRFRALVEKSRRPTKPAER